ncbi:hypothetical protein DFH07DRAFT_1068179 [Mycena maculata]|uniref:Uncharacterized protein n=1 Tax=Mycena maculata TaxID=230809 RepID=A0AAD7HE02_9AGAR|nr:hypothetical protein DFH07DRAFT_1068179 [Mycena maculata]
MVDANMPSTPTLVAAAAVAFVALQVIRKSFNFVASSTTWPSDAIPSIGIPGVLFGFCVGAWNYIKNGRAITEEGFLKYPGKASKVAFVNRWLVIVNDRSPIEDIRKAPDDSMSLAEGTNSLLHLEHTLGYDHRHDPYQIDVVRTPLTRNIGVCFPVIRDEVAAAFEDLVPAKTDESRSAHTYHADRETGEQVEMGNEDRGSESASNDEAARAAAAPESRASRAESHQISETSTFQYQRYAAQSLPLQKTFSFIVTHPRKLYMVYHVRPLNLASGEDVSIALSSASSPITYLGPTPILFPAATSNFATPQMKHLLRNTSASTPPSLSLKFSTSFNFPPETYIPAEPGSLRDWIARLRNIQIGPSSRPPFRIPRSG